MLRTWRLGSAKWCRFRSLGVSSQPLRCWDHSAADQPLDEALGGQKRSGTREEALSSSQAAAVPALRSSSGADLRALLRKARAHGGRKQRRPGHPGSGPFTTNDFSVSRSPALPSLCVQDVLREGRPMILYEAGRRLSACIGSDHAAGRGSCKSCQLFSQCLQTLGRPCALLGARPLSSRSRCRQRCDPAWW